MKVARLLAISLVLLAIAAFPSAAAPLVGPCAAGAAYDPACDVNHDGSIDIFDIQLTAGHWGQTGIYNIYPATLPKTGQTTSYAVGDDGALQKGVAWPNPRFTDNGNGTVIDNLTGLIWLKNANCYGTRVWATALTDANTLNSGECGLTDGSVEGDWRLPNVREMQSLVDYGRSNPALPSGHPFTGVSPSDDFWTSTTKAGYTIFAWYVTLDYGHLYDFDKVTSYRVWPVRDGQSAAAPLVEPCGSVPGYAPACDVDHDGDVDIRDTQLTAGHWGQTGTYSVYPAMLPKTGQTISYAVGDDGALQKGVAWPNPRFTDNSNGTVTDNLTGLVWLKNANCANDNRLWATALSDMASLNSAGTINGNDCGDTSNSGGHQTDWRLPNVREMQSLVDYGRRYPALPSGHPFTGASLVGAFWASTTTAGRTMEAWFLALDYGNVYYFLKVNAQSVWPVRGGQ